MNIARIAAALGCPISVNLTTAADVLLIVEVSDTSLRFDLDVKMQLYGRAGIGEAWLIDLEKRQLHQFNDPDSDHGYRTAAIVVGDQKVSLGALPNVVVSIAELFPA